MEKIKICLLSLLIINKNGMLKVKTIIYIQAFLLVLFFIILYWIVGEKSYADVLINNFFQNNYTESWKQFFILIAEIWDKWGVALIALFVSVYFYIKKYYTKIIVLLSSMALWVGSSIWVKHFIGRLRPENMIIEYGWYSFPSGHSVFAILFYWLLLYLFWNIIKYEYIKYIMLLFAIIMWILVMLSRLYLSVHYISDVFAWAVLGLFWLLFGVVLYRKLENKWKI